MPTIEETHGPDRCRTSLNCPRYHDPAVSLDGKLMHQCCCNTCISIRPGSDLIREINYEHCCRCVPRLIHLRFTPASNDPCCKAASVPMIFAGPKEGEDFVSVYTGSLYGITVTAELGVLSGTASGTIIDTGTGTSTSTDCIWRVTATRATGTVVDLEVFYVVDDQTVTCLDVSAIVIGSVEGPNGCDGTLSLANMEAGRLPFIRRDDIDPYCCGTADIVGTGSGTGSARTLESKLIELDPPCGDCTQVCSVLCLDGSRRLGGASERVEFWWFDNGVNDRGWRREDPIHGTETIFLVESGSGTATASATSTAESVCELDFDWSGDNGVANRAINVDNGCACGIKESVVIAIATGFVLRCGVCTYWQFFCGTCRCVPLTLCAQVYSNNTFVPNVLLDWDEPTRCWTGNAEVGTGSPVGTSSVVQEVKVCIGPDDSGGCILTATIGGEQVGDPVARDCGTERISGEFDPSSDFISATFEESTADDYTWMIIQSQTDECTTGGCDATGCSNECGSDPDVLTLTVIGENLEPGTFPGCSIQMDIHRWEVLTITGTDLTSQCGYTGVKFIGVCDGEPKWVIANLIAGELTLAFRQGAVGNACNAMESLFADEETCDPYLWDSGVIGTGLTECCMSCDEPITQFQIVITE